MPSHPPTPAHRPRVLAGTSGFSYPAWRGHFYPDDLPARDMLAFYARALGTVEINHTFHRLPTPALLLGWARQTPPPFRFALKAPQRITHHLRLRDAAEVTGQFCTAVGGLGRKLGPLLFRSDTWFTDEIYALLAKHRAALCIADSETLTTPPIATAPWGYFRLRRENYSPRDLDAWAERIRDTARWKRVYVYFKHEDAGRGPALARALLERLGS